MPASCPAARALSAKTSGVSRFGGSLTRSRVSAVAWASARAPASASCPSGVSARGEMMEMVVSGEVYFEVFSCPGRSSFFVALQE